MTSLQPWSVRAINLPEHADNPIHTDAGALAAGFPAALVAGTTVYAYMTRPPVVAWGESWLASGGGELRLKQAVLDNDVVDCVIAETDDGVAVEATVDGEMRASFGVWHDEQAPAMRGGDALPVMEMELTESWADYGVRGGDDLTLYADRGVAHPALWPSLANAIFKEHLVVGSWIHTRSRIYHQSVASVGEQLRIESTVFDRFATRAGERAVVDLAMFANDRPVCRIEHEALVALK